MAQIHQVGGVVASPSISQVAGSGTLLTATGGLPNPLANRLLIWLPTRSAQAGVKLDQVIYERTWVHVGLLNPRDKQKRGQALSMFVVGGKATYEPFDPKDSRIA